MPRLRIDNVTRSSAEVWDAVWRNCRYATFFQSVEWAEVWRRYTDNRIVPAPLLITFTDGARALLPFCRRRLHRGLAHEYVSSPAGTYGGWISDVNLMDGHVDALLDFLTTRLGSLTMRLNPYAPPMPRALPGLVRDATNTLPLTSGFASVTSGWSRGHFSAARKGLREGVVCRLAACEDDWRRYYRIYEDSLRRWGDTVTTRYEWRLFDIIQSLRSPHVKLWLAEINGQLAAGALCFCSPVGIVYWHGAAYEQLFQHRPVQTLVWSVVQEACNEGVEYFDFNPSGGLEGVRAFKKGFGTVELPCPVMTISSQWRRFVARAARLCRV